MAKRKRANELDDAAVRAEYERLLASPDELEELSDRLGIPEDGQLSSHDVMDEAYRRMTDEPEAMPKKPEQEPKRGARNQLVARAGEYFVVAELNKRGAYAVTFAGNMPKIDILACAQDQCRKITIQVKTKRGKGNWHSSIVGCKPGTCPSDPLTVTDFWVFVNLGESDCPPTYWIVPDWWVRDNIFHVHQAYLARHGGSRAHAPDSTHHSIDEKRLDEWKGRWDILQIFP